MSLWSADTIMSLVNNFCHEMREGDWNITPSSCLKKPRKQFLYDGKQNVPIRTCHILEYSCTIYLLIDISAVEMEFSLKKGFASFGWHI